MKQKFRKLTFVKVGNDMPPSMRFFDKGFLGIVDGTYSQLCGGDNINSYALYKIEDGVIVNRLAWYKEYQLTEEAEQDRDKAEDMIEDYTLTSGW